MHSADGLLTIVYNGEIYNYLELRDELRKIGRQFRSNSDTEVILAAYEQWGEQCPEHFNGFWAFAIYDRRKKLLFCSRDRFGLKPFHYVNNDEVFAFGSEIKQLLEFCGSRKADFESLQTFLLTGLTDYSEQTMFAGVKRLMGGHNLTFDLASGRCEVRRYYELRPSDLHDAGESEMCAQFLHLLCDSVRLRLRSDVQVATCLSGGLDSSAIARLASCLYMQQTGKAFAAVTAQSVDRENDETEYARKVVEVAELEWHRVRPSAEEITANLADLVYHQEEPFPGLSVMMQFAVMKATRAEGIPVLLDGQGADEILLGYPWHIAPLVKSTAKTQGITQAWAAWRAVGQNSTTSLSRRLAALASFSAPWLRIRGTQAIRGCGLRVEGVPAVVKEWAEASADVRAFQVHEIAKSVLPALLRYEDRNSMAFAVEGRLPFLDYRLVEFAVGLPTKYKIRDGWSKWILRKSIEPRIPQEIAWRKKKIGFEAPDSVWNDGVIDSTRAVVKRSELLRQVADVDEIERLTKRDPAAAWKFHSVALWAERFNCSGVVQ
jgi:asparagine synthase (glutamine-hydrolysing)